MITLTLLHPLQAIPVQSWVFEPEPLIRIGRSTDNEVVLYSAVVSRHHVEIRRNDLEWELVNLGANGTYIDGKRIVRTTVVDGMVLRLASSGPKIQIRIEESEANSKMSLAKRKRSSSRQLDDSSKDTFIT
ncbi:MAG: FHA domain-containing protein [Oscillatoria sp. PMC 1068.18]|nr:FHA domain-containing protein [Oscillatoria sp. PMC 1068.18]